MKGFTKENNFDWKTNLSDDLDLLHIDKNTDTLEDIWMYNM